jgi:hypothetical protein
MERGRVPMPLMLQSRETCAALPAFIAGAGTAVHSVVQIEMQVVNCEPLASEHETAATSLAHDKQGGARGCADRDSEEVVDKRPGSSGGICDVRWVGGASIWCSGGREHSQGTAGGQQAARWVVGTPAGQGSVASAASGQGVAGSVGSPSTSDLPWFSTGPRVGPDICSGPKPRA